MREFLHGLLMFFLKICMTIPFNNIRIFILRMLGSTIGKNVFVGRNCDIRKPENLVIGNNVAINPKVLLDCRGGTLRIGNNVDIAQECIIWTETHDPHDDYHRILDYPTTICDFCWLGCRAIIMPGVHLGEGVVVASGAIVTKNIENKTIVAGIPAKKISMRRSNLLYSIKYCPYFR